MFWGSEKLNIYKYLSNFGFKWFWISISCAELTYILPLALNLVWTKWIYERTNHNLIHKCDLKDRYASWVINMGHRFSYTAKDESGGSHICEKNWIFYSKILVLKFKIENNIVIDNIIFFKVPNFWSIRNAPLLFQGLPLHLWHNSNSFSPVSLHMRFFLQQRIS